MSLEKLLCVECGERRTLHECEGCHSPLCLECGPICSECDDDDVDDTDDGAEDESDGEGSDDAA